MAKKQGKPQSQVVPKAGLGKQKIVTRRGRGANKREYASAGPYTTLENGSGNVKEDVTFRNRARLLKQATRKTAGLFSDGGLGYADIADSQNIGMYSYEFPVDALELPASRQEELRFYRLAYDRDPIASRAINLHTEIPLSKFSLEKPKSSSDEYSDYIYDFFQSLVNDTQMFQALIDGVREQFMIGESFLFIEEPEGEVELSEMAKRELKRGRGRGARGTPMLSEAKNGPIGGSEGLLDWLHPEKRSALLVAATGLMAELASMGISFSPEEQLADVDRLIALKKRGVAKKARKIAKTASLKLAAPGDPGEPPVEEAAPEDGPDNDLLEAPAGEGGEEAPVEDLGGGAPMMGGGGGGMAAPGGGGGDAGAAVGMANDALAQVELKEMKYYLKLLEKKRQLLQELKDVREKKQKEMELFSHIVNQDYLGLDRIQILPPEQVEVKNADQMGEGPQVFYKPADNQKQAYLEDPEVPQEVKDAIEEEGLIPLNQDPFKGSYVIHFARKKSGYELHGRSILQPVLRTIIYRDKLRQVQTTLASRNMTPKTLVVAPEIPTSEVMALRAHIDEAKADPDYTVVCNYEVTWQEIGSEGRLLALDAEWQHTNSDLSIGLGFSPEILIGEGMYGGNRIQLELMNTSYLQFRDTISTIIEDKIFKPIAMKKGFYELDKFGRPRWIYPKVTFSRMALRDSGDLYDMMFNLYAKGSLPVGIILEFLNIDPETVKRQLEEDLYTVNDSKFNDLLANVYTQVAQNLVAKTDIVQKLAEGMQLKEQDIDEEGMEGSGEGV